MTQYLLSIWSTDQEMADIPAEGLEEAYAQVGAFNDSLQQAGAWVFGGGLEPSSTATKVDSTQGDAVVTDGPFLETKEQLGGFWVIEAPDLDAALAYADQASKACFSPVEVRPFQAVPTE
ncbi:YciI family protein [Occultella gossypii]|uniref:YCII-related domain-containing protein n=1 Tax=Occultella gossypii TaxID=2800820 RepID=A0ABS7SHM3_9MICO|nr:YciI family protein [Occultella gossypii]MBZ2198758.1 hypothetical protein [Occultella gossypii]